MRVSWSVEVTVFGIRLQWTVSTKAEATNYLRSSAGVHTSPALQFLEVRTE